MKLVSKINSQWIKDLCIRYETMNLPEENAGEMFRTLRWGRSVLFFWFFCTRYQKHTKKKKNKWDCIKLKGSAGQR
jgi:hypothetical protein